MNPKPFKTIAAGEPPAELTQKLQNLWRILHDPKPKDKDEMFCFIMYDIENHKVRRRVAKYLLKSGCLRIQKSIFVARLKRKKYELIYEKLKAIQEMYDNHDSIIFSPIQEESLVQLKCIGKNFAYELVTHKKNLIFV